MWPEAEVREGGARSLTIFSIISHSPEDYIQRTLFTLRRNCVVKKFVTAATKFNNVILSDY